MKLFDFTVGLWDLGRFLAVGRIVTFSGSTGPRGRNRGSKLTRAFMAEVAPQAEVPICVTCLTVASCSLQSMTFSTVEDPPSRALHNSLSWWKIKLP